MKYLSIILFSILLFLSACHSSPEPQEAAAEETRQAVLTATETLSSNERIKTGSLPTRKVEHRINCTGQLSIPPSDLIAIHSKTGGQVQNLRYLPGDYVQKGTRLLSIEHPQLVEKQRLLLETKAQLSYALKDYERKKLLRDGEATTEKAYDESLREKELLSATYSGLKEELQLLGVDVVALEKEQAYQARVHLYAPQSGFIHQVLTNQGQMVSPEDVLLRMANNNHIHVELQVLSQDIGYVQKGQKLDFNVPGQNDTYSAELVKINPMLEAGQATLQVHAHITGEVPKKLIPGLFVNATILAGQQSLTGLPESGVVKEGETYYAYLMKGEQLEKVALPNAKVMDGFVAFVPPVDGKTWVIEGAYYVE